MSRSSERRQLEQQFRALVFRVQDDANDGAIMKFTQALLDAFDGEAIRPIEVIRASVPLLRKQESRRTVEATLRKLERADDRGELK